jgi:hypothetical protein
MPDFCFNAAAFSGNLGTERADAGFKDAARPNVEVTVH